MPFARPEPPEPPARGAPLRAGHVFAAVAERLADDAIVFEESPSNRPELLARLPARQPLGMLSPAMGGLGFALPAATGIRMACPDRPVVAFVGDGSSLYSIQSLWSAAHYSAGALFVILSNGGYAVMDRLSEQHGGTAPWPAFGVDVAGLARAFGCPARTLREHGELLSALDEVVPGLASRDEPLLLEVVIRRTSLRAESLAEGDREGCADAGIPRAAGAGRSARARARRGTRTSSCVSAARASAPPTCTRSRA